MEKARKTYSKEFKQKAVELSNVRGNVQEIVRELGVPADFIYRWRKEQSLNPSLAFSGNGKKQLTEEQKVDIPVIVTPYPDRDPSWGFGLFQSTNA